MVDVRYSGEQVNRAGEKLRRLDFFENETEFRAVLDVISYWRSEHDIPLKIAFEALQATALEIDRKAIFAKRLKRTVSIAKKMQRFASMDLRNMQDIGGCRAIITNQKKLNQIMRALKRRKEFRWNDGRFRIKNYIEEPKPDGYRSVHLIGNFPGNFDSARRIEVQLRTFIQHYWATALEIVDLFTAQALKSNQGDAKWSSFFRGVADHFSAMDGIHLFETMNGGAKLAAYRRLLRDNASLRETLDQISDCCRRLKVMAKLEAFAGSLQVVDDELSKTNRSGFVLLKINIEEKTLESEVFPLHDSQRAEAEYIALEKETAKLEGVVVALVSTTAVGGIKEAYPNYFADSSHFVQHLQLILKAY